MPERDVRGVKSADRTGGTRVAVPQQRRRGAELHERRSRRWYVLALCDVYDALGPVEGFD